MTGAAFVWRGLTHFRASYLGVLAGAALGSMVLLGALMAGDSVKGSLRRMAEGRLGKVDVVLSGGDRMFRAALAEDFQSEDAAPVLVLRATATAQKSGRWLGGVQVLGVDERFWRLGPDDAVVPALLEREFHVNEALSRLLGLAVAESLVLRFEKPRLVAADAPLAGKAAELVAMRGEIAHVCGSQDFGDFNLAASQLPLPTVFVPLPRLQEAVGLAGKANLLVMRNPKKLGLAGLVAVVKRRCTLEDYGLRVVEVPLADAVEVRSSRVFIDHELGGVIRTAFPSAQPVITYMANTIAANGNETPYSLVTAVDRAAAPFLPAGLHGVVLNGWEAEDLGAKPGDEVRLDYYALAPGGRLVERSARFPVAGVVPLQGLAADRQWMPDFPGVAEAEDTADWDAGVPIDLKRIRTKDEEYWDAHRGTPKLFLPYDKGRELFGNRWGDATAFRIPGVTALEVALKLREMVDPSVAGLMLRDVRTSGLAAAESPVDFAGLFLGMSFFLILSALILTALLFRFHIEQRNRESGLLAALGIPPAKILRWHLAEGACVVTAGSVLGLLLALGYTRLLLASLGTIWKSPASAAMFGLHLVPATVVAGMVGFVVPTMAAIWLVARRQGRRMPGIRLAAGSEEVVRNAVAGFPWMLVLSLVVGAAGLAATPVLGAAGAFFIAGSSLLLAGLAACRWRLARLLSLKNGVLSPGRLAQLNLGRRPARSLAVVAALASGVFLVVSVASFRKHTGGDWRHRQGGTGGFAFWVETTIPVKDLPWTDAERAQLGEVLRFRVGQGDDASCFNLNQVNRPRLLATDAAAIARLGAFPVKNAADGCTKDWKTLAEPGVMRAFVDESTLLWVLRRKLGESILYQDEWGREFPVTIAGTLDGTVFQGSLVVDEARYLERFPSAEGSRLLLTECDGSASALRGMLGQSLRDYGAMVSETLERLQSFHAVENAYIAVFHVLGGLGVLVGSAGLGLLTAANLRERRHEFGIMRTLGVPDQVARGVVLREASRLIAWGLGIGGAAAIVAILPSLPAGEFPESGAWTGLLVLLIAANAWLWSWFGYGQQSRRIAGERLDAD